MFLPGKRVGPQIPLGTGTWGSLRNPRALDVQCDPGMAHLKRPVHGNEHL